jgi:hypothetical protein
MSERITPAAVDGYDDPDLLLSRSFYYCLVINTCWFILSDVVRCTAGGHARAAASAADDGLRPARRFARARPLLEGELRKKQ